VLNCVFKDDKNVKRGLKRKRQRQRLRGERAGLSAPEADSESDGVPLPGPPITEEMKATILQAVCYYLLQSFFNSYSYSQFEYNSCENETIYIYLLSLYRNCDF
jgi:hypothetical protein